MLKEAIEYIVSLGGIRKEEIDCFTYTKDNIHPVLPPSKGFDVNVYSLVGLVDYIKNGLDCCNEDTLILNIENPERVTVSSSTGPAIGWARDNYIAAQADIPRISLNKYMSMESFIIQLKTCFDREQGDWESLLSLSSMISVENGVRTSDDGISQTVVAKTGVARLANVDIPNTIKLAPIRTFHEVEQPLLEFVFRIDNAGSMGLFEADGGAWKGAARARIKEYLSDQLNEYKNVHILG